MKPGPSIGPTSPVHGPVDSDKIFGYTPYDMVSYCTDKTSISATVEVIAPREACFLAWKNRRNHMQFLTLVEEIGYDSDESTTTFYMFLYRWAKLPTLQLVSEIERTEIVPGELIKFQNKDQSDEEMLPLEGAVRFEGSGSGSTSVTLEISYAIPNLLLEHVGKFPIEQNIKDIIHDNLMRFKAFVEGSG
eukprot:CAMPEP_0177608210 /NCGR_PEP_ID=MMETSP0419_2-20121207/18342_1 /TAXON_ID=582737 /ORGANISM="Tetraselmis sp., Strain GSL018" /LENGTH=189 /DNA_ID=CAMNT_0019102869 /DNA_START=207 /DNA_END=776 /DNA_ORIENTATION=+